MTEEKEVGIAYSKFKILYHPEKLKALKEGKVTAPIHVRIKPTNRCDHACFSCAYDYEWSGIHPQMSKYDEIPFGKMDEILSDFSKMGVKAITYSGGGEPLIYSHITSALEQTLNYGIDFAMNTNGQNLNGKKAEFLSDASWLRISANAVDEKTFSILRRRPPRLFYDLMSNISNFAKIKSNFCSLGINYVVHKENVKDIYDAIKLFKDMGVDNIKFTPVWGPRFFDYHKDIRFTAEEQIKRARQDFQDLSFKIYDTYEQDFALTANSKRTYDKCYNMQVMPAIGADCGLYVCFSKAYDRQGLIGSLKNQSFKGLWFSKKTAEFFNSFNPRELCNHQCPCDEKNILLTEIVGNGCSLEKPITSLNAVNFA